MKHILFLSVLFLISCSSKPSYEELEDENNAKNERIEELEARVNELEYEVSENQDRIVELEGIIDDAQSQARKIKSDLIIWNDDPWMVQRSVNTLINILDY